MKKHFLTGLVILLPLVITIAFVIFLVNFLTEPFVGMVALGLSKLHLLDKSWFFLSPEELVKYGSKLLILIFLFALTIGIGFLTRVFFANTLLKWGDQILLKIPFVNTVYKTVQDIIKTLFTSDSQAFKQVVMVPFPRAGSFVVGLIARDAPAECSKQVAEDLVSVFIPTTPNPTTGFLLLFKRCDLIRVAIKPEDALKYIISCGVILPPGES